MISGNDGLVKVGSGIFTLTAANTYLGLMAGLTISTSIPVAVLTVVTFRVFTAAGMGHSILESNISQTVGSASSSVASGVLFTIPSLFIWGMSPAWGQITQTVEIASSPNPVGSGARALGMGGAFIGVADDATAAYANPSGLVQLVRPEVSVEGRRWGYSSAYTEGGRASGQPSGRGIDTVAGLRRPVSEDTWFDLASLTKPLVTTTLALKAIVSGGFGPATRVEEVLGECAGAPVQEKVPTIEEARERWLQAKAFLSHKAFANVQIEAYEAMADAARPIRCMVSGSSVSISAPIADRSLVP